jgi:hypothetical protein
MALHDPKVLNVKAENLIEDRFVRKLDESGVIDRLYRTYGTNNFIHGESVALELA